MLLFAASFEVGKSNIWGPMGQGRRGVLAWINREQRTANRYPTRLGSSIGIAFFAFVYFF